MYEIKVRINLITFIYFLFLLLPFSSLGEEQTKTNQIVFFPFTSSTNISPLNFSICSPGLVLVPLDGGIKVAGWDFWLYKKNDIFIKSLACNDKKQLFLISQENFLLEVTGGLNTGKRKKIFQLPSGNFKILSNNNNRLLIYGQKEDREWVLFSKSDRQEVQKIWSGNQDISSVAFLGRDAFLTAIEGKLLLWRKNDIPLALNVFEDSIDGLAAGTDGSVFVSLPYGIFKMTQVNELELISKQVHGSLQYRNKSLYVLSNEESSVVQINFD
jgi:hypothetical protein